MWPVDEDDFVQLVASAVKDRRTSMAVRMRDALAGPDVIGRTVAALETVVDRIDAQLRDECPPEDVRVRRERARDGMWDSLVWYRQMLALEESVDADS